MIMKLHCAGSARLALAVLLALSLASAVRGQCALNKVFDAAAPAEADFGDRVAISGDVAVISVPDEGNLPYVPGDVKVYRLNHATDQWEFEASLVSDNPAINDGFGRSVDISGDVIVVGADDDAEVEANDGAAYVFRFDGASWVREVKLTPSDPPNMGAFGNNVAIDGDVIAVSVGTTDGLGQPIFAAVMYRFDGANWVEEDVLPISDPGNFIVNIGDWLDVSGNLVIGSNPGDTINERGVAFIYRYDGVLWNSEGMLLATDAMTDGHFGLSCAIEGDVAVVGRPLETTPNGSGTVFIFRHDGATWNFEQKLFPSDAFNAFGFGSYVSISNGNVLASMAGDDDLGSISGSALLLRYDTTGMTWYEHSKLLAFDGAAGDQFGSSVALDGDRAVIGAKEDDDGAANSGSAYFFTGFPGNDCNTNNVPDGCELLGMYSVRSAQLSPIGDTAPHTYVLPDAPMATGDVTLAFSAVGDYSLSFENVIVRLNGSDVGTVYDADLSDCSAAALADQLLVPMAVFNSLAGGDVTIEMDPTTAVNADLCDPPSFIQVAVEIPVALAADTNDDGVIDECEPPCPADTSGDGSVDINDLLDVLSVWGACPPPCPEDTNGDEIVDITDLLGVLAAWGPCP